jgi:hypothetical protein
MSILLEEGYQILDVQAPAEFLQALLSCAAFWKQQIVNTQVAVTN